MSHPSECITASAEKGALPTAEPAQHLGWGAGASAGWTMIPEMIPLAGAGGIIGREVLSAECQVLSEDKAR